MIHININDIDYEINVDPNMPLLWALRDILQLTGTKYGCGTGICGSCTVLANGSPIRSCLTPVSAVSDKKIITIEGIKKENEHIQKVWAELNVPQCGYCQPGQIVSATALLRDNPHPTDKDIDLAMSGHICRCGTYMRIRKAIHQTAKLIEPHEE